MSDRAIGFLVVNFAVLTLGFSLATVFVPDFQGSSTLVMIILGAYVSLLTGGAVGSYVTRDVRKNGSSKRGGGET